jgi:hypothetical protein
MLYPPVIQMVFNQSIIDLFWESLVFWDWFLSLAIVKQQLMLVSGLERHSNVF